jgi:hypothetical protein
MPVAPSCVTLLSLLALLSSCERRSPGPAECRRFSLMVFGVERREELKSGRHLAQLDQLTRDCLVTPYDRALLRCVEESRQLNLCRREFAARRAR